jgi:hypothetical protein
MPAGYDVAGTRHALSPGMSAATITTDHAEIRSWVEQRGGYPARLRAAVADQDAIRIDFPGFSGEGMLERLTWDEWFALFERHALAFLHQDETEDGQMSHFNKLVSRASVERKLRESVRTAR